MSRVERVKVEVPSDPRRQAIRDKVTTVMRGRPLPLLVQPHEVLVALWEGEEKIGSIYVPDQTKDENIYQGKTGMIIVIGEQAFQSDADHVWPVRPVVGDWVVFRVGDGFPLILGDSKQGQHCRLVHESKIRMVVDSPDMVW